VNIQSALLSEALAALMAYKRFLARVDAIVSIEMTLIIGGIIASLAQVLLPSIHRAFEDLFTLVNEQHGSFDHNTL